MQALIKDEEVTGHARSVITEHLHYLMVMGACPFYNDCYEFCSMQDLVARIRLH